MEKIINRLNFAIFYRKSSTFWNIDSIISRFNIFSNKLNLHLIEISEYVDKPLPTSLHAVAMLPSDTDILPKLIYHNKDLFWVHSMFAGVEKFLALKEISENKYIILTNSKGAFGESLAEFAIFSMLYFSYNSSAYVNAFKNKKWITPINKMINGKTLVIVGYGLNGSILAKKAKMGHNMKIIGIKKNIKDYQGREYVDEICHIDDITNILPGADFIVNFLPNTSETINFYDYEKFKLMKSSSVFINLGRGSSVKEEDLIKCLSNKLILGASLDVFKTEPLSSDSPFYDLDNVLITCHSCDFTDEYFTQAVDVLCGNLNKYFNEGILTTYVDKKKGY